MIQSMGLLAIYASCVPDTRGHSTTVSVLVGHIFNLNFDMHRGQVLAVIAETDIQMDEATHFCVT